MLTRAAGSSGHFTQYDAETVSRQSHLHTEVEVYKAERVFWKSDPTVSRHSTEPFSLQTFKH